MLLLRQLLIAISARLNTRMPHGLALATSDNEPRVKTYWTLRRKSELHRPVTETLNHGFDIGRRRLRLAADVAAQIKMTGTHSHGCNRNRSCPGLRVSAGILNWIAQFAASRR